MSKRLIVRTVQFLMIALEQTLRIKIVLFKKTERGFHMPCKSIGIFAHVDAGKTTLSEQLLVHSGRIREAGSVDRGTAHTDDLPVERRRGISVKATCVSFEWKGTDIQLIDTPGHTDFSAEIERSLWALDAAVLLVDAVQGVQPQTEILFRTLRDQKLPFLLFFNKTDRPEANPERVLDQIRRRLTKKVCPLWDPERMAEYVCGTTDDLTARYLEGDRIEPEEIREQLKNLLFTGEAYPALCGSALKDIGIPELLDAMLTYLPGPESSEKELSGVAFAVSNDRTLGRGVWVRLFSGKMENRMPLDIRAGTDRLTGEPVFVQQTRGEVIHTETDGETVTITALVPAASSLDYPIQLASETGGRGSMSTSIHGYRECPETGHTMARRGVDPLNTAKYILAARNALESEIY